MKRILAKSALVLLAAAVPVTASAQAAIEGRWVNPKHSVIVSVERCGPAYCGTVIRASEKARATARKGGTPNLIGTQILSGVRPDGSGAFRGRAFDPKRNLHAPATIRLVGSDTLIVKGCVFGGFICKEQRWTRIS
jgi:uncharacterized protein (DUF2147 family)